MEICNLDRMPWRPIEELTIETRYGDESGFLLLAPELVDEDCNVHGVGMGYWQDGPVTGAVSQGEIEYPSGTWFAGKWSMTNDEWYEIACTPTHYIRLKGV